MDKIIKTADGTETLFNEEYGEAYHSTKAGAYQESLHKFVNACRIPEIALKNRKIDILDVGFGLGYNVAVAINEAIKKNPNIYLNIISIEKDKNIFDKIKKISIPEELANIYNRILTGKFSKEKIGDKDFDVYTVNDKNFSLKIIFSEGREVLKNLVKTDLKFDAVFFDPFSPKVNTEMWTVNVFKLLKQLIKPKGILATYSASLGVRKGLQEAGFKIGLIEPIGRKSYSTVATIDGEIPPLTEREKERLEKSPYALPYYDNDELTLSAEDIKLNWERELNRRLKNEN
jgi:chorismate dehydratase